MNRLDALRILNVSELASEAEIKSAYRKLALAFHPDRNHSPDAREQFIEIHEAYEFLSRKNTTSQRQYAENQDSKKSDRKYRASATYESNFDFSDPQKRYERAQQAYEEAFERRSQRIYQRFFDDYKSGYKRKLAMVITAISTLLAIVFVLDANLPSRQNFEIATLIQKNEYSSFYVVLQGREIEVERSFYFLNKGHVLIAEYELSPYFQDFKSVVLHRTTDGEMLDISPMTPASSFPLVPLILAFPLLSFLRERPSFNFVFFVIHTNLILMPLFIFLLMSWGGRIGRLFIYFESLV